MALKLDNSIPKDPYTKQLCIVSIVFLLFCLQNVQFLAILGSWSDQLWRKGFVRRFAFLTFLQIFIPLKITFIQQDSYSKEEWGKNGGGQFVAKVINLVLLLHPF